MKHEQIKQPLAKVWDTLKELGPLLQKDDLDHGSIEILLADAMIQLDHAHDAWMASRPRDNTYAIGIEHKPGEFGMIAGPTTNLQDMLEFIPGADIDVHENVCIVQFTGTQGDPQDEVVYRWARHHSGEGEWMRPL